MLRFFSWEAAVDNFQSVWLHAEKASSASEKQQKQEMVKPKTDAAGPDVHTVCHIKWPYWFVGILTVGLKTTQFSQ